MEDQTSPNKDHDDQGDEEKATPSERSPSEQAKEREREMEESGEENAT